MQEARESRQSIADPFEGALEDEARLNQVLLDAIPCVALLLRPDREVVLSNKAGKDAGAYIGTQCFATWGQREEPCPWCLAPKAVETGEPQNLEVEALGVVWDAYWIPLGPELYLHYAFDVTEQRKTEYELRGTKQYLESLIENSTDAVIATDEKGNIVLFNPGAEAMLGYRAEEVIGRRVSMLYESEAPAKEVKRQMRIHGGKVSNFEVSKRAKDGTLIPVLVSASILCDEAGREVGTVGFSKDLRKRKEAEDALRKSEERYRSLAETSTVGTWHITPEGQTIYVNPAMCEMLEIEGPEELEGKTHYDFFTPESIETFKAELAKRRQGISSDYEVELIGKRGTRRDVIICGAPVLSADGILQSLSGTFIDISERKRAEEEQKEAAESLMAAHAELVRAYDRVSQAQATVLASEKLAAVGRLTAGVSHEILNPLNTITISLHVLLQNSELPVQVTEDLQLLMEQTRRITKISQDLLFFSRQRPPERRAVDVNETVQRTLDLMAYELKLSNVSVELKLAEGIPEVQADQDQLQQVVLNLLTNARDAMGEGGRLAVATRKAPALWKSEAAAVELRVEDTGPGIPPEHMDKIFEPFFTTKAEGQGTGMGLSICHGIVESHGGRLWAENAPQGGAAFVIHLPLGHDQEAASP